MIYDLSYFQNNIFIPNLVTDGSDIVSENDEVLSVIKQSDVKFLTDCFGFNFAKEVLESVEPDGTVKASASQLIKDLIDGDASLDWQGLRFSVNDYKFSLMANYAFCQYLTKNNTKLTTIGNVKDNAENGQVRSNWSKYVIAWNEMMLMRDCIYNNYRRDWYYNTTIKQNTYGISLEEYILNKEGLHISKFKKYELVNSFGL